MAEGGEVFRIALEQLKQGTIKKEEFLEIARSDLSLRQANLEEAWEKKKQAEADKRRANSRLVVKVLKGTDVGKVSKSGQRKEIASRGLYVKVKFGREEQRTANKRCKQDPIWGSSSLAMKFNYNPDNLGLLPDIMSFEVWGDHFLQKDRLVSSGRLHIATALASGSTPKKIDEPERRSKNRFRNFSDGLLGTMKAAFDKSGKSGNHKGARHARSEPQLSSSAATKERATVKRMDRDAVRAWKKAIADKDPKAMPNLSAAFDGCLNTFKQAVQNDAARVLSALPAGNPGTAVICSARLSAVEGTDVYFQFDFPFLIPPDAPVPPKKLDMPPPLPSRGVVSRALSAPTSSPAARPRATTIGQSHSCMPRHHSVPLVLADTRGRSASTSHRFNHHNDTRRNRSSGALEILLYLETDPDPDELLHKSQFGADGMRMTTPKGETPRAANSNTRPMQIALQQFADDIITQEEFMDITKKDIRLQQQVAKQNARPKEKKSPSKAEASGSDELSEVMRMAKTQLREGIITQQEYEMIATKDSAYRLAQQQQQKVEEAEENVKKQAPKKAKGKNVKPATPSQPKQHRMNTADGDSITLTEFVEHANLLDTVVNGAVRLKMQAESGEAAMENMERMKKVVSNMGWGVDLRELKDECLEFFEAKRVSWTNKVEGMREKRRRSQAEHGAKFRAFRQKLRVAKCIRKQDEKIESKYLLKMTKAIRENFFPREAPIFEGQTYEGEYKDLLERLAWIQIGKGAKTSTAFACADFLPLIASRDEVMELAAKIATLLHSDCTDINLFNRVSATPIAIKAAARTVDGEKAAFLESQTKEVLRFIKGPPTMELDVLEDSWVVTVNLKSSVTLTDVEAAPLIERRFQVTTDNEMVARLFARRTESSDASDPATASACASATSSPPKPPPT